MAPGSELGLRREYVKGRVTMAETVRMKKGKNCPWQVLKRFNVVLLVNPHLLIVTVIRA